MRFINKVRENYHYRKAEKCFDRAINNRGNQQVWIHQIMMFFNHWEKYNDLLAKRLGII